MCFAPDPMLVWDSVDWPPTSRGYRGPMFNRRIGKDPIRPCMPTIRQAELLGLSISLSEEPDVGGNAFSEWICRCVPFLGTCAYTRDRQGREVTSEILTRIPVTVSFAPGDNMVVCHNSLARKLASVSLSLPLFVPGYDN